MSGDAVLTQAIDPASDRAVYKQIADHLREAIGRGRLREGDQLPSEAQLMGHYGVARMTIRSALRMLQSEGLTRRTGRVTKVGLQNFGSRGTKRAAQDCGDLICTNCHDEQ